MFALRALDCEGNGLGSDIIAALEWVEEHFVSPAVVTLSLGLSGHSNAVNAAVDALVDAGVVVVRPRPYRSNAKPIAPPTLIGTGMTHIPQ